MKKVIYITGCLGFIGSYITKSCLEMGWYIKGVDKITYAANYPLLKIFQKYENFSFIHSDINDLKFLYDCDYIINTAAETHVGNSISNSHDFISSNINGVHNILELLKNYRQENEHKPILIHFSTDEVYGDNNTETSKHTECDLLKPSNPYSASKAAGDMLILAWARTYDISYIIVRPANNYGIGQYVEKLIPKACKYIQLGKKIPLHNGGTPIRTWLHAEDTAYAILKIIEKGQVNNIYNICGGFEQSNKETVDKILQAMGKDNSEEYIDFSCNRAGQDLRYSLDDSKLRNLGWVPQKKFEEDIVGIVDYYKEKFIW